MPSSVEQVFSARKPRGVAEVAVRMTGPAAPDAVWALLATPARWADWSPHVRRAVVEGGQADAPVAVGDDLVLYAPAGLPLRATVTLVEPGARWDFLARPPGPWAVAAAHAVRPSPAGSEVAMRLRATGPAAAVVAHAALLAAVPVLRLSLSRLQRLAAAG